MAEEYEVTQEDLRRDILWLIQELQTNRLVHVA